MLEFVAPSCIPSNFDLSTALITPAFIIVADGIIALFKQCADFQIDKDLSSYTSVVVLDEVGLAEDSPRMPLKVITFIFDTN